MFVNRCSCFWSAASADGSQQRWLGDHWDDAKIKVFGAKSTLAKKSLETRRTLSLAVLFLLQLPAKTTHRNEKKKQPKKKPKERTKSVTKMHRIEGRTQKNPSETAFFGENRSTRTIGGPQTAPSRPEPWAAKAVGKGEVGRGTLGGWQVWGVVGGSFFFFFFFGFG